MSRIQYIDPVKSADSLRRNGTIVEAARELHAAGGVLADARRQRVDSAGALGYMGLRHAAHVAAGTFLGIRDTRKVDAALRTVAVARAKQMEGRLDDASCKITSDRMDNSNPSAAIALARELEYIYSEVMREERPIRSALSLFDIDRRVTAGAKTHTIRRIEGSGEAQWYRGGMAIPLVGIGRDEETFNVRHAVIGADLDFFSAQSDAYAGINEYGEKIREMRDSMDEFINIAAWNGSTDHKVLGILNYPWLRKRLIATAFTTITTDAGFQTALDAIYDMVNEILDRNPGMSANLRFITSPRFNRFMAQQRHPTSQVTLKQQVLAGIPAITSIEEAPELQNAGPSSEDGVLIVPKGVKSPKLVIPTGFTMMPLQVTNHGFTKSQAAYQSTGGVTMRDVLRSALIWASVS